MRDEPVRPGGQTRQQEGRRDPGLNRLGQNLNGAAIGRVIEQKGPVEPPSNKPAGAQSDAGGSLRAKEGSPVIQKGFPGGDLQGVIDGGVPKGHVWIAGQIDPYRVL